MKRDNELIRRILLAVEDKAEDELSPLSHQLLAHDDQADITYNALLLGTGGFLTYQLLPDPEEPEIWVGHLTSQGYQLLEQIRNDTVWNSLKQLGMSFSFQVLTKALPTMVMGGIV